MPSEQLRLAVAGNLEEARVDAVVALAERLLRLGRAAELISELTELGRLYPLREALIRVLVLALYADGRQAEALDVYDRTRRRLADELGIDSGPGAGGRVRGDPPRRTGGRRRRTRAGPGGGRAARSSRPSCRER